MFEGDDAILRSGYACHLGSPESPLQKDCGLDMLAPIRSTSPTKKTAPHLEKKKDPCAGE